MACPRVQARKGALSSVGRSTELAFEPPGKGPWELESTHFSRPVTAFAQGAFAEGFVRGFAEGTARYGLLLDHFEPGHARAFLYVQPVAFGAPEGAMGPPPKPVLQLLTRLHPAMRKRIARSAEAIESKLWREDLRRWDEVDKPAAIAKHRVIQAVDVQQLSDEGRRQHLSTPQVHHPGQSASRGLPGRGHRLDRPHQWGAARTAPRALGGLTG